ncbi:MerR family transcriptional regulator [Paenilisteria rocourtiae]|uniref:MerR family transcriptional regulator n=1 Tax=Listeria rocourtiae TaxID=647910 RepID=A0A4R6ZRR1_9LIST|nr:MerR family transcriptional regulator [Listeria rocourtiae]EUJ48467.1 MerR family transcriptional regulator [Listeria rocourtiae FSL F6-920]MBC1436136.1 MerR family transcriptional regulator [Listeria rocourtiae]TDR54829.1 MerR family transcriptional regulator [Listeria rocourtiae]
MFQIGEFSRLANVSIRSLRHYDKIGLLVPEKINIETNYRYYSAKQLQTINKIQKLKEIGLGLSVINEILSSGSDVKTIQSHFAIRELELQEELETITQQRLLLESSLAVLKENSAKWNYHIIKKEIPKRFVASVRDTIPTFASEGLLWERLYGEIIPQQAQFAKEPFSMAIFHDEVYRDADVDVEVQVSLKTAAYDSRNGVAFKEAPEVSVASVIINGSYEQMTAVTEAVAVWLENHEYQLNGPMFNIYHVSIATEPNPENWVTEACFPIKEENHEV